MLRLVRYLKPYTLLILLTIALLFVQANADLALPDYMADIVNIGIQLAGVENAIPVAVRQTEMDKLMVFMSAADKNRVLSDYTLVDTNSPDYAANLMLYPQLAQEPIYILNKINPAETDWLNPVMGKALMAVSGIQQLLADPAKAAGISTAMGLDITRLPPGSDVFSILGQLPAAQISMIRGTFESQFAALGDDMIIRAAAGPIKAEYLALGMDTSKLSSAYIIHIGGLMLLVTLVSGICMIAVGYLSAKTAAGLAKDLRRNVFQQVESFSNIEFDKLSTASLITRSTNDVTQIQSVVMMMMRMVFYAPIIGVGAVIHAMAKSNSMMWIIALAVIVLLGLILIVFSIALPKFKIIQSLIDRLNLVTRENLSGMMVIRAFNMQQFEETRFDASNKDLTSVNLFISRIMVIMMPLMMLIMNGVSVLIIWVGAHQISQYAMQVGDMMAFMQYAMQIFMAFLMMAMMFIILPRASVSGDRIADVLETEPVIKDPQIPETIWQTIQRDG